ncbi:Aste57867_20884 [Aphanomyces stellatus]|uniref:Aste57867_20884 protein n=1 Tax=Aphanomyces stellatus TaxID=120398 RepID=A0A485LGT7_9STRA|nr:hypothetical protein As57867_020816 [Aphanomyces stellatus]VFT97561.1 Aste57867_20884 [Aphanomyces stellatus]
MPSSDAGSDTSVEGLIERFRRGYPPPPQSPRRTKMPSTDHRLPDSLVVDPSVEHDIAQLHRMVRGKPQSSREPTPRHHHRTPHVSTSPSHHQHRPISPSHLRRPTPSRRPVLQPEVALVSPRNRLDVDIAAMLLDQQGHTDEYDCPRSSGQNNQREIHVTPSTADIIRKTAVDIDKDMTHVLAGFVERHARDVQAEVHEEQEKRSSLPVSALTVASELDVAFELLTKKAKGYNNLPSSSQPREMSADQKHAAQVVQTHGITTDQELCVVLARLDHASEAAAATSPLLDHIIHAQAATDDRDLNAILTRLDMSMRPATPHTLFAPTAMGGVDEPTDLDCILAQLQHVKTVALQRTQAIDDRWKTHDVTRVHHAAPLETLETAAAYTSHYHHHDVDVPLDMQGDEHDMADNNGLFDDEDNDDERLAFVSARDIVEDLSVAMHTLRHRLNLDEREKLEKEENEKRDKETKARAAADADAAKQRAEQEKRDEANARARVLGRTACELNEEDDDMVFHTPVVGAMLQLQEDMMGVTTSAFEDTNVLLRFDMLVRETYEDEDAYNNQVDEDVLYAARPPRHRDRRDIHRSMAYGYSPKKASSSPVHPYFDRAADRPTRASEAMPKSPPMMTRDYTLYSMDELRRAREAKMAWLQHRALDDRLMNVVDEIGRILQRAEAAHGRGAPLSLVQVLEEAALDASPSPHARQLNKVLLAISLEPSQNWWHKLHLHVARLTKANPAMDAPSVRDRFFDVLSSTMPLSSSSTIASQHRPRAAMSLGGSARPTSKKHSGSRRPVEAVVHPSHIPPTEPPPYHSFRTLACYFQAWASVGRRRRRSRLEPVQVRALFRWMTTTVWSDPVHEWSLSSWTDLAMHARVAIPSTNLPLLHHADRALRRFSLAATWRAWTRFLASATKRTLVVHRAWLAAVERRRNRCFRAWAAHATCVGRARRHIVHRARARVQAVAWASWRQAFRRAVVARVQRAQATARLWRHWVLWTQQRRQTRRLHDTMRMWHARRVKQRVWRTWQSQRSRGHRVDQAHAFFCRRRLFWRWRAAATTHRAVRNAMQRRSVAVCRRAWQQLRVATHAHHATRLVQARCDAVARCRRATRALRHWRTWHQNQHDLQTLRAAAAQHAGRTMMAATWQRWLVLVAQHRRLHMLRDTLPRVFAQACHSHWFHTWVVCTRVAKLEAVDATEALHRLCKQRFWRQWKKQMIVACIVTRVRRQFNATVRAMVWRVWRTHHDTKRRAAATVLTAQRRCQSRQLVRILRVWREFRGRQQTLRGLIRSSDLGRARKHFTAWTRVHDHRRLVQRLQTRVADVHRHATTRCCWFEWRMRHAHEQLVQTRQQSHTQSQLQLVMVHWHRRARHAAQLKRCVGRFRGRRVDVSLRAVCRRWRAAVRHRRHLTACHATILARWRHQATLCAFYGWRAVHAARHTRCAKLASTVAWWQHRNARVCFGAWRAVTASAARLRHSSRLVQEVLGHHGVARSFRRWRLWRAHRRKKQAVATVATHFALRRAVRAWRADTRRRYWMRAAAPRAMQWQRQRAISTVFARWRAVVATHQALARLGDLGQMHWARRTCDHMFAMWMLWAIASAARRTKAARVAAMCRRRRLRAAVEQLHFSAVVQRKLRTWTHMGQCAFFTGLSARVVRGWRDYAAARRTQRHRNDDHKESMADIRCLLAVRHWHCVAHTTRQWTEKLRHAKRWFLTNALNLVFVAWKGYLHATHVRHMRMREILSRWQHDALQGRVARWRGFVAARHAQRGAIRRANDVHATRLQHKCLCAWLRAVQLNTALKHKLQEMLGTRAKSRLESMVATWRCFVVRKKNVLAKVRTFLDATNANVVSAKFCLWVRHTKLGPQLRRFRFCLGARLFQTVIHAWRRRVRLMRACRTMIAARQGRSVHVMFAAWRDAVVATRCRRHSLEHHIQSQLLTRTLRRTWSEWLCLVARQPRLRRLATLRARVECGTAWRTWCDVVGVVLAKEAHVVAAATRRARATAWGLWRMAFLRQRRKGATRAAVDALVDVLDELPPHTTDALREMVRRWQVVTTAKSFEQWAAASHARRAHRVQSLQALLHWEHGQLERRFHAWHAWAHGRRQRRLGTQHWTHRHEGLAVSRWIAFVVATRESHAMASSAAERYTRTLLRRSVETWAAAATTRVLRRRAGHVLTASSTARLSRRVWYAWNEYRLYRRDRETVKLVTTAYCQRKVLLHALRGWGTVTHALRDARAALQATVLRLEVLLQLSCFRAWRDWLDRTQGRRRIKHVRLLHSSIMNVSTQTILGRRRRHVLRRIVASWFASARRKRTVRQRADSCRRLLQLGHGVHALQVHRQASQRRHVQLEAAGGMNHRHQHRQTWTVYFVWHMWARQKYRTRLATSFAMHRQMVRGVREWHVWACTARRLEATCGHLIRSWKAVSVARAFRALEAFTICQRSVRIGVRRLQGQLLLKVFGHWALRVRARQAHNSKCRHVMCHYLTSVQTKCLTRWRDGTRARRHIRSLSLVHAKWWTHWRLLYNVACAGRVAACRQRWHRWLAHTAHQKQKREWAIVGDHMAVVRAVRRWSSFRHTQVALSHVQAKALQFLSGRLEGRILWRWKRFVAQSHEMQATAVAFASAVSQRQVHICARSWVDGFQAKKAQQMRLATHAAAQQRRAQQEAVRTWHLCAKHQRHALLQSELAWRFRADVVVQRCLLRWFAFVSHQSILRQKCMRVGELIMGNTIRRLFGTWTLWTKHRVCRHAKYRTIVARSALGVYRLVCAGWRVVVANGRARHRATDHAMQHLMRAHLAQWKRHHVLLRVLAMMQHRQDMHVQHVLQLWQAHTTAAQTLRTTYAHVSQRGRHRLQASVFAAWKGRTRLKTTQYYACVRWWHKTTGAALVAWCTQTQRMRTAKLLAARHHGGRLHLDTPTCWHLWRRLYHAHAAHRRRTSSRVLCAWAVVTHVRRRQAQVVAIALGQHRRRMQQRALHAWASHVSTTNATRRQLLVAHHRDLALQRLHRAKVKRTLHAHVHAWVAVVQARKDAGARMQRRRDDRLLHDSVRAWRHWLAKQQLFRRRAHARRRVLLGDAVTDWHARAVQAAQRIHQSAAAAAMARRRVLQRRYSHWSGAVSATRQVRVVVAKRSARHQRDAVDQWLTHMAWTQLTQVAVVAARRRLQRHCLGQWKALCDHARHVHALRRRAWRHRVQGCVRAWATHRETAQRVRARQLAQQGHMTEWRWRQVVLAWHGRTQHRRRLQEAATRRLRQLWRRWHTFVQLSYAVRFHAVVATRRAWLAWRHVRQLTRRLFNHADSRRQRTLAAVFGVWLARTRAKHTSAQATIYARLKRQLAALMTWQRAVLAQQSHNRMRADRALQWRRRRCLARLFEQWTAALASARDHRRVVRRRLVRWQAAQATLRRRRVWRAWHEVKRRRCALRHFVIARELKLRVEAWDAWSDWRRQRQRQAEATERAAAHCAVALQRRVMVRWHVLALASNAM